MGHLYHGKLLNKQMITTQESGGFPLGHGGFVTEDAVLTTSFGHDGDFGHAW